jgi:6-phosphofructokinase 1
MRVGILTGGGDAPGLNGIIEATTKTLLQLGHEVVGIQDGFLGVFELRTKLLTKENVEGIHAEAGTILGTTNRYGTEGREDEFLERYEELRLEGLIVAGGDGTFRGLQKFGDRINIIGAPKTIDNDLSGTEITFGFDTACSVVAEAVDALRATANAHGRIIVVETMGRTAGWMALGGGLAAYADAILIPEIPFDREKLLAHIQKKIDSGQRGIVLVVSEGAHAKGQDRTVAFEVKGSPQEERLGGISERVARWLELETGREARHVILGHLQRSRNPTTTDRFLTLSMGAMIGRLVAAGRWGHAVVYRNGRIIKAPLSDVTGEARLVEPDHRWVRLAKAVGIYI